MQLPFQRFATIVAIVSAMVGAILVLGSHPFLETLEAPTTPATLLLLRMLGCTIGGMAVFYIAARNSTDLRFWTALLIAGTVQDGGMTVLFNCALQSGVVNAWGWAVEGALAAVAVSHLALLVVMFRTPR